MPAKKTAKRTKKKQFSEDMVSLEANRHNKKTSLLLFLIVVVVIFLFLFSGRIFTKDAGDTIVAKVDSHKITLARLDDQYTRIPSDLKSMMTKDMVLQQLVDEYILMDEAKRQGMVASKKDAYDVIRKSILASQKIEEEFYELLAKDNITKEYLTEYYIRQLSIQNLLNKTVISKIDVTDQEIKDHYEKTKDRFIVPESRNASHILIRTGPNINESLAFKRAVEIKKEATIDNFATLAMDRSDDQQTAVRGGLIGLIMPNMTIPEFNDLLFSMEEGSIGGPVRSTFGYHIILLHDIIKEHYLPLKSVESTLEMELSAVEQQSLYNAYLNGLRNRSSISIYYKSPAAVMAAPSFRDTGEGICIDNGKPFVAMYSTSDCTHCAWIAETFKDVVWKHAGNLSVHHYMLDTGDDLLTKNVETSVNVYHLNIFKRLSPTQQVPLFVFGCKYVRLGNAHEKENDLVSEKAEFEGILDEITKWV
ncbi:hypothetical protein COV93_04690 [Candidatus Woesearchaeota archaeon CG11_big_fil_rev_8_21_14_0_20_43_8]|nr:MAG: hypothetical protein COV93_04690 [Candidatus Woesearchaeota archaeon CG11_big_fil_rev_8_21_14_0_20_43_8]